MMTNVHPAISKEMSLFDRSVEMAEAAFTGITTGAIEARHGNVMLGSARVCQSAGKGMLTTRAMAGKLAFAEAKLVEASQSQDQLSAPNKKTVS